ncbi:MAG: hypothetical protein ACOZAN_02815 [Patescibacteria group bacterium]
MTVENIHGTNNYPEDGDPSQSGELSVSSLLEGVLNLCLRSFTYNISSSWQLIPERNVLDVFGSIEKAETFCQKWPYGVIIYPVYTPFFTSDDPNIISARENLYLQLGGLNQGLTWLACKEEIWLFFRKDMEQEINQLRHEIVDDAPLALSAVLVVSQE